jgi:hypothetical protein
MPIFLLIAKHSRENCPLFNRKARKVMMEAMDKSDGLMKKHRVKMLGSWAVPNVHTGYEVYEAPSLDAFMKLGMEPATMAMGEFNTMEIKAATSYEEVEQVLKHAR